MAYCTLDDLKKLISVQTLLQLTDDEGIGSFVVDPPNLPYLVVLQAITDAETLINSYLGGRYTVPVTKVPVPPMIVQIAQNLALCNLYDRKRDLDLPEGIKYRRDRHIGFLKDIGNEKAEIPELENTEADIGPAPYLVSKDEGDVEFPDTLLNMM